MQELIIDSFAGGGGASLGIAWATGRSPDIAINHDADALVMHEANHPDTVHVLEDVWKANLQKLTKRKPVGLLWLSPDCKHFSRAKGGKPVEKNIRSLAWIACKWAEQVKPKVIVLENVRELEFWGPLVPQVVCSECGWKGTEGQARLLRVRRRCPQCDSLRLKETLDMVPDPSRKGLTFKRFVGRLRNLGYAVQHRNLDAASFGAPTHRRRLFLVARRDGQKICWPDPTHGKERGLKPYRTAAECIDWQIPCPSIFGRTRDLLQKQCRNKPCTGKYVAADELNVKCRKCSHVSPRMIENPLAEKTLRRIALGIHRYVLTSAKPFIVQTSHTGTTGRGSYVWDVEDPLRTVSQRSEFGIVTPILSKFHGSKSRNDSRCKQMDLPFNTLDTQPRFAVIAPTLVQTGYGEREGQSPRAMDIEKPLGTVVSGGQKHAVVAANLVNVGHGDTQGSVGRDATLEKPLGTITSKGHHALVTAFLAKHFGGMVGVEISTPLPTVTTRGTQNQIVTANLIHLNHGDKQWSSVEEPMRTLTTGKHAALVYAFMIRFFGESVGQSLQEPSPAATGCNKTGLVTVVVDGELYVMVDIGMRMLTPRELARAQGFPDTYELTGTKTSQVAKIGNSVSPNVAAAVVSANCGVRVRPFT